MKGSFKRKSVSVALVGVHAAAASSGAATLAMNQNAHATSPTITFSKSGEWTRTSDILTVATQKVALNNKALIQQKYLPASKAWTKVEEGRFDFLVTKEALSTITSNELEELENLQDLRRANLNPISGDDILQQYRQSKIDEGMLNLLRRYVQISPRAEKTGIPNYEEREAT